MKKLLLLVLALIVGVSAYAMMKDKDAPKKEEADVMTKVFQLTPSMSPVNIQCGDTPCMVVTDRESMAYVLLLADGTRVVYKFPVD